MSKYVWIFYVYVYTWREDLKEFVCVEVLLPSQPIRVMLSAVSLANHTLAWAGLVL